MGFAISNTSAAAVITSLSTPSSITGELTITSGSLPLVQGGFISGSNTTITDTGGSPFGSIEMFLQQGDAQIDTFVNNTLYSSDRYGSGFISLQTPIIQSGDSLTMAVSDADFDCYSIGAGFDFDGETIKQQTDGKLVIGGYFTTYQRVSANYIVRLNTDFSIDDTFDYGTGFNGAVNAVAIQSDGKILVCGAFTAYSGVSESRITRLNTNGSVDTTFVTPTINDIVYDMSIQSDGKIVAVGDFTQVSGVARTSIVRFLTGGTVDSTFSAGTVSAGAYSVIAQSDGKIIVGGGFATVSGTSSSKIVRLLSGGTRDTSFVVGNGFRLNGATSGAFVVDITPTQNGKYLISGIFDEYSGTSANAMARLNSNGSIDTTFNQGTGLVFDESGFSMPSLVLSNGNIVVSGLITGYDGVTTGTLVAVDPFGQLLNCEI